MEKNNQPLIIALVVIGAALIVSLALIFTRSDNETETPPDENTSNGETAEAGQAGTDGEEIEFEVVAAEFAAGDGQIVVNLDILNRSEESFNVRCFYAVGYTDGGGAWAGDNKVYTLQPGQNNFIDLILAEPGGGPPGLTGADLVDEFEDLSFGVTSCKQTDDAREDEATSSGSQPPISQPGVLPANWDSLTPQEKADLNPFDCDHAIQWVSADDGSCINKSLDPQPVCEAAFIDAASQECLDYIVLSDDRPVPCIDPPIDPAPFTDCKFFLAVRGNPTCDSLGAIFNRLAGSVEQDFDTPYLLYVAMYTYNGSKNYSGYSDEEIVWEYYDEWDHEPRDYCRLIQPPEPPMTADCIDEQGMRVSCDSI